MLAFIIGLIIGGFVGVVAMAMMSLASDADRHMKKGTGNEE